MALEQGAGAGENFKYLLLTVVHAATLWDARRKTKSILHVGRGLHYAAAL
jgi:hypothetical protein